MNTLLVVSYGVATLVDIAVPLVLGAFLARRYQTPWRYWLYGFLVFLLFQGITRIPVMLFVQSRPFMRRALEQPTAFWLFLLCAAATAGLFEEGGRWLAFRFVVPREERQWRTALMLGAGHGGLESIAIGLITLAALIAYATQIAEAKKYFAGLHGWEPLLSGWERLGALVIQLGLSVMVLQAFLRRGHWWWFALAAHTIVDFTTPALLRVGAEKWGQTTAMLAAEGLVAVYALLALWFIAAMRLKQPSPVGEPVQQV